GNPPFLGAKRMTGRVGADLREHLVVGLAGGKRGNADLVAYFVLRAAQVARSLGLLATNTISQGDTREVGLDQLLAKGWTLHRAVKSTTWPGSATIEIAKIWAVRDPWNGRRVLGGSIVRTITASLDPGSRASGSAHRLAANTSKSFIGSLI